MFTLKRAQAGFTLIEVVAAAALLGLMVTMAMPSLNKANSKVKDSKLQADLATVDQAIQLYVIDHSELPEALSNLSQDYINKIDTIKDAKNGKLQYSQVNGGYNLTGKNSYDKTVYSNGSVGTSEEDKDKNENVSQTSTQQPT